MAFTFIGINRGGETRRFYNFDQRVTKFGGAIKTDVMLLQALFRIAYYELPDELSLSKPAESTGPISVDGIVGSQTRIHIQHFQANAGVISAELQRVDSFFVDGVIDPIPKSNLSLKTKNTKSSFELGLLNTFCNNHAFQAGQLEIFQRMIDIDVHTEDDWPKGQALRSALRIPRKIS